MLIEAWPGGKKCLDLVKMGLPYKLVESKIKEAEIPDEISLSIQEVYYTRVRVYYTRVRVYVTRVRVYYPRVMLFRGSITIGLGFIP